MALNAKHVRGAQFTAWHDDKANGVQMATGFKVGEDTSTTRIVTSAVTQLGVLIENHLSRSFNGRIEFDVDRVFEYLDNFPLPVIDIGKA